MKAQTWVLLRGLCRESRHWGEFLPLFQQAQPQSQIVAMDFPGVGQNRLLPSPRSIEGLARFVKSQLLERGLKPPYSLFAISLGGMVALDWISREPEDIELFVIANTSDRHSPFYRRMRYQVWRDFISAVSLKNPNRRERQILKITSNVAENYDQIAAEWTGYALDAPIDKKTALAQLFAASRFRVKPPVKVPGVLIVSLGDRLVDPSCSMLLGQILARPIITHPWAGHDITLDDPHWVTQKVIDFLRE